MKQYFILLFSLFITMASAQEIRYDTVRVSPNDERNIYRATQQPQQPTTVRRERATQPIRVQPQGFAFDRSKLRIGANLGLSLSRNYTVFGVGPQVGYQFSDLFMAGAGVKYYYTKVRTSSYEIKNNMLGTNLFGYFYPVRFLTVFAQPEINYIWSNLKNRTTQETNSENGFVPSLVVGAGLRLGRSHLTLNYDLVQNSRSPYPSGFFLGVSAFF